MSANETLPSLRQRVIQRLSSHGISPTRQRIEIGVCLFDADQHFTADQLLDRVRANCGDVSKATIYNTLGLFARKGLVREVVVDPSRLVYDTNTTNHHHIYNLDTEELKDIGADLIQVVGLPQLEQNLKVEGVDVVIRVRNKS